MKKQGLWCVAALVLAMSLNTLAGWMEDSADFWAECAAKEFKLTPEQKQAVSSAKLSHIKAWQEAKALKEAGDVQGAEEKERVSSVEYLDAMMQAIGTATPDEIWDFNRRTREAFDKSK